MDFFLACTHSFKIDFFLPCTPHSCSQLKRRCGYFASHRRRLQSSVPLELSFILHFGPLQSISHEALIQVQRVPVLSRGAPAPSQPHRHLTAPLAFLHTPVLNHSGATGHRCPSCADAFPGTTARGCTRATAVAQLLVYGKKTESVANLEFKLCSRITKTGCAKLNRTPLASAAAHRRFCRPLRPSLTRLEQVPMAPNV